MDGEKHNVGKWDMMIAHPPCTYLTTCANRCFSLAKTDAEKVIDRWEKRAKAAVFFMRLALADIPKICVENPQGFMNTAFRKPDQTIHPYFFAESENDKENYHQKKTNLWLKGLESLRYNASIQKPEPMYICQGEKSKGKHIGWCEGMRGTQGGKEGRAKARSKTFPGIAKAMAEQWG